MIVTLSKPDWRIRGGFEVILTRVEQALEAAGHEVRWAVVDVHTATKTPFGVTVRPHVRVEAPEFFRYAGLVDAFASVDAHGSDLVISTQPPSWAVRHPTRLALFFHHLRIYYDLSEAYVAAGFVGRERHLLAQANIRRIDEHSLASVRHFLVPGSHVRRRLEEFGPMSVTTSLFQPGINLPQEAARSDGTPRDFALCVSRHEFPKRVELFVHAMLSGRDTGPGVVVGSGGRAEYARRLAAAIEGGVLAPEALTDSLLWCNTGDPLTLPSVAADALPSPSLRFAGRVSDEELAALYNNAFCVVAPALFEDYGLTALEAMSFGRPVIVCSDGGGLVELVEHGETGLVVEPTSEAIAEAVSSLRHDEELRRRLAENAREVAAGYTWQRAIDQLLAGVEQAMST